MKSGAWTGNGVSLVAGANEAFDLMVYAEALVILHGYEKIRWPDCTGVGRAGKPGWSVSRTVPNRHPHRNRYPRLLKNKNGRKTVTDDVNPGLTSEDVMNQNDIEAMIQRYIEAEMAVLTENPSPLMVSR